MPMRVLSTIVQWGRAKRIARVGGAVGVTQVELLNRVQMVSGKLVLVLVVSLSSDN